MRYLALTLAFALTLGAAAGAQQQPPPKPEPPDINFAFKVDKAIDKGVAFLRGKRTGSFHMDIVNGNELILLTLIHAGVPERYPDMQGDFDALLKEMLESKLERTYKVALQAMCLEEIDRVKYQPRIHACAQFLVDNISPSGTSRYGAPSIFVEEVPTASPGRAAVKSAGGRPENAKKANEQFDPSKKIKPVVTNIIQVKQKRAGPGDFDHSNMQYHALGLRACHDSGIRFEESFLKLVEAHWRTTQIPDAGGKKEPLALDTQLEKKADPKKGPVGATSVMPLDANASPDGWGYSGNEKSWGSMTVGAVGALCILDYMMGKDWRKDEDVLQGLQWMNKHMVFDQNPELGAKWHYYYVYGVERVGMLFGTERIGTHMWYREGAEYLLAQQGAGGNWNDVVDTCFAILFLRRATRRLDVATGGSKR
jgi:hypothetical protein